MSASTKKSVFRLAVIAAAVLAFAAQSFAALPEIRITTLNNANPDNSSGGGGMWGGTATYNYVAVSNFQLSDPNNSANNITRASKPDSIRVRGNSTAGLDKKPYRIKFGEKIKVFGDTAARSWVLLANYYDGTFALTAMAFELGKRLGVEFTNRSWFVDVYINNQYKGLYQLTEQVQSHKGRVDLKEKHRGWLAEFDYHDAAADERNSWFKTAKYDIGTFIKWPQLDDTSFTKNPNDASQLNFVKTDINNLVNKMSEGGFPTNGYRDLIDLESFAKYVLIQLVMDNFDFNSKAQTGALLGSNYAYRLDSAKATRIKAGPLWDFDLSAGVTSPAGGFGGMGGAGSFPAHYQTYQDPIEPTHAFYKRLWEDPAFKAKYLKAWNKHKSDFQAMSSLIDNVKSQVEGSVQGKGANKWANNQMMGSATLTTQAFNTEVQNLKTWWTNRLNFVDQKLRSYNIDTTKDVDQSSPPPSTPTVTYTLTTTPSPQNGGTINRNPATPSSGKYDNGAVVTLTAVPANDYTFSGWSGGASGTAATVTVTMNSDKNVTATFVQNPPNSAATLTLTTTVTPANYGSITITSDKQPSNGKYEPGTVVTLRAVANSGYKFSAWSGGASGTTETVTVTMNENQSVTATFVQDTPVATDGTMTLTATVAPANYGTIELIPAPPPNGKYVSGINVTIKAVANSGYKFSAWSGDFSPGQNDETADSITVLMYRDRVITATFTQIQTSIAHRFGTAVSGMSVVGSGLRISAAGRASMKVVSLTGAVVRRQAFNAGNHAVSLGGLPRGMYLVRTEIDGVKRTVRMPVR